MRQYVLLIVLWAISAIVLAEDLLTVYQKALEADPNLRMSQLQIELSASQQAQAGGALLPQVSANVNISYNDQNLDGQGSTYYKGKRYSVSLTQPLFDVSKIYNWKRYQTLTDKANSELLQARQILQYDTVDRYFTVLAERDNLALVEQEIKITEKQLKQVRHQFEKRMIKITDVYELEAKLDDLYAQKIEINTRLDNAKRSLKELTGAPVENLARLKDDIQFTPLKGDIKTHVEQAKRQNPLIKAQNDAIKAANYNLNSQYARHLPVVDLQLQYYNTDTGYQNRQTPVVDTKVAAINITVPIFSGGSTYQQGREASKQLAIDKQKKIALLRAIEKEARNAFLSANASIRRIKAAEKAHKTAIKAREAMEKGFRYGMQSIGDVLVSQSREFSTHRDLLDAKYSYIKNRIRFEQVSGVLSEQTLAEINGWLEASSHSPIKK